MYIAGVTVSIPSAPIPAAILGRYDVMMVALAWRTG